LGNAIVRYGQQVAAAVHALGQYIASRMQTDMRRDAKWVDRTGNARSGLFAVAERAAGDVVTVYLSHGHTVDYGKWLELSHAGRYAIVMPTLQRYLPEIERMLKELFRG
jgi:hypothetical protein